MKRLLFLVLVLWPGIAFGQTFPDVYAVASPAQVQGFDSTTHSTITTAVVHRVVRATCTAACYIWVNASGQSFPVTKATGIYLPADTPQYLSVSPGSTVRVVGDTAGGSINVLELSR